MMQLIYLTNTGMNSLWNEYIKLLIYFYTQKL